MQKRRINVVTMGCSKNLVDSEVLLSQLERGKFEVAHDSNEPGFDAVFINTCGFIHDAKQESIDMILDYVEAKKRGDIEKVYVMGCLPERYQQDLEKEIPEVDRYFGKFDLKAIVDELKLAYDPEYIYERKITTPSHYAYLKVSEGCNRSCAFCAIPLMTGRYRSRSLESLLQEARYLVKKGVRELIVIAQDLSYYGTDLYGKPHLAELVSQISAIDGVEWIRLHYLYPTKFPYEILPVMRENESVCKYLDLPLQHIANPVLKNMLRHVTREETELLIQRIREVIPGVILRTTMLVGYPGETEADFEELKQFVRHTRFDRLGVFTYSHEEGTYAGKRFRDDVPEAVKQARANEIMEIQQQISGELNRERVGRVFTTVIDRREGENYIGRTQFDSPEVDGEVIISAAATLQKGAFYNIRITGSDDYDLFGEVET